MPPPQETYTYQKRSRIAEVLLFTILITLISLLQNFGNQTILKAVLSVLLTALVVYLMNYHYLLNNSITLSNTSLKINRRIGKSTTIPFSAINRIVLREAENTIGGNRIVMTLFTKTRNHKIITSDLIHQQTLVETLAAQGRGHNFKLIHQSKSGKIIKD